MSKRNIIIIIIGIVLLITAGYVFLIVYSPSSKVGNEVPGVNFISNLLPFGKRIVNQTSPTAPANISGFVQETPSENLNQDRLTKISSMPVAGFGVFMKERFVEVPPPVVETTTTETATSETTTIPVTTTPTAPTTEFVPAVRYADKAQGNIYQTFADTIDERKFSSTIIPQIYDAYFGNKGESVAMRYLDDDGKTIQTFIGTLPKETLGADTVDNQLKGSFFPENISNINISPNTANMFYLFNIADNQSSAGVIADPLSVKKTQIFSSPFTEWLSWWPNNRMVTLTTKPSANVPGYMYALDPENKNLNKILGNINGLTTLTSPSGKLVLYSGNNLALNIYDVDTKETIPVGLKSLPEKCIWAKLSDFIYCAIPRSIEKTGYPDIWYQGEVSFSDQIWIIDVNNGTTSLISDPVNEKGESIDAIKLALDENEGYLFFVNKIDSYLWELSL